MHTHPHMRTVTSRHRYTDLCEHTHMYPCALARLYALRLWTPFSWEEPAGRRRCPGPLHLCPGTGLQGYLGARPTLGLGSASCTLDDNTVQAQPSPLWLPPDRFLGKFFSPAERDRDCGGCGQPGSAVQGSRWESGVPGSCQPSWGCVEHASTVRKPRGRSPRAAAREDRLPAAECGDPRKPLSKAKAGEAFSSEWPGEPRGLGIPEQGSLGAPTFLC